MKNIFLLPAIILVSILLIVSCAKNIGEREQVKGITVEVGREKMSARIIYDNQGRIKTITATTPEGKIVAVTIKYEAIVKSGEERVIINDSINIVRKGQGIVYRSEEYTSDHVLKSTTEYTYNSSGKIEKAVLTFADINGKPADIRPVITDYVWVGGALVKETTGDHVREYLYTDYENKQEMSPESLSKALSGDWIFLFSGKSLVSDKLPAAELYDGVNVVNYADYKFNASGLPLEYKTTKGATNGVVKISY